MSLALKFHGHNYNDSADAESGKTAWLLQVIEFLFFCHQFKIIIINHCLQLQINGP